MPSLLQRSLSFMICNEKLLLGAFALALMLICGEEFPPAG
jgi:hypothetical protein